jgi:hypothetical protein
MDSLPSTSSGKHNRFSSLPAYLPSNPSPTSDTAYSLWGMPRLFLVDKPKQEQHRVHRLKPTQSSPAHSKKEDAEFKVFENNLLVGLGIEHKAIKNLDEDHEVHFTPTSENNTFLKTFNKYTSNDEDEFEFGNQTSFDSLSVMSEESSPLSPRLGDYVYDANGEEICQHFLKGKCRFRERCRNSHNIPNCIYCMEELPINRVAASAHLHHCWRLSQKQQTIS